MKIFQQREVHEARAYAAAGGQALHLFDGAIADAIGRAKKIPNCFRGRKELGHLFDQDSARLQLTARRLGVRVVFIHHAKSESQHIDLCGGPLERARSVAGSRDVLLAMVDSDAREMAETLTVEWFHCERCKRAMVSKDSLQIGRCLWCRDFAAHGWSESNSLAAPNAKPPEEFKQQYLGEFWDKPLVERSPANTEGKR